MDEAQKRAAEERLRRIAESIRARREKEQKGFDGETHPFFAFKPFPKGSKCIGYPTPSDDLPMEQAEFMSSDAQLQGFFAPNRIGKTYCGDIKQLRYIRGRDPSRPEWRAKSKLDKPFLCWHLVDPKKTRSALFDFVRLIPGDMPHRVYTAKGEERVEFGPSELRPHGSMVRILSNMLPLTEYQRDDVDLMRLDEMVRAEAMDELDQRTLTSGGQTWWTATPLREQRPTYNRFEKLDPKYRCAQNGPLAWFAASQYANPKLVYDEIEKRAKRMSPEIRRIRVLGEFLLLEGTDYFNSAAINWIADHDCRDPEFTLEFAPDGTPDLIPYDPDLYEAVWTVWEEPDESCSYAIGADVAQGEGDRVEDCDFSAAYVYCVETGRFVAKFHSNIIRPIDFAAQLAWAGTYYNEATIAVERNSIGSTTNDQLIKIGYRRLFRTTTFTGKVAQSKLPVGWLTTNTSKRNACDVLELAIRNRQTEQPGAVVIFDTCLLSEMREFARLKELKRGQYGLGASDGGHDDLVMAAAITLQAAKQAPPPRSGRKVIDLAGAFKASVKWALKQQNQMRQMSGPWR